MSEYGVVTEVIITAELERNHGECSEATRNLMIDELKKLRYRFADELAAS